MGLMMSILKLINGICKLIFISYVWITMIRVNAYIAKQEREDRE